ncbi:MAG: hypothetical protein IPJ65_38250 [Archangiaceae bacterium]|nr:hypothetical protein [Archangiaceae bacterium]
MKLYGSLVNRLYETQPSIPATVGEGATEYCYSDRHAYTVVAVSPSGKACTVRRDIVKRQDTAGMSECQTYTFEADPQGNTYDLRLNKKGQWVKKGQPKGNVFVMGLRSEYYDYSF